MKVIITMAGNGSRFFNKGINTPKYKIIVNNRSLFEWSILSLSNFFSEEFIFISREDIWDIGFVESICNKYNIKKFKYVLLKETTNGQATTVMMASHLIDSFDEISIYNIDTYVKPGNIVLERELGVYGVIPVFKAEGEKWSFVIVDKNMCVKEVAEKKRISDLATIGFYYFSSWKIFVDFYIRYNRDILQKYKEVYIAPLYQYLIDEGLSVKSLKIKTKNVIALGTPEDIELQIKNETLL